MKEKNSIYLNKESILLVQELKSDDETVSAFFQRVLKEYAATQGLSVETVTRVIRKQV
jgi:hypothetical protein